MTAEPPIIEIDRDGDIVIARVPLFAFTITNTEAVCRTLAAMLAFYRECVWPVFDPAQEGWQVDFVREMASDMYRGEVR